MKKIILKFLISLLEKLKKQIEKPKPNSKVSHLRTDKNGNAFYAYKIQDLPDQRAVYFQAILNQMANGIDNDTLKALLNKTNSIVHSQNASNLNATKSQIIYQLLNIEERADNIVNTILLEKAALIIVTLEGEPVDVSSEWNKKKLQLWEKDEDSKVFFWNFVLNLIKPLANISEAELKSYLTAKANLTI